MTKDRAIYFRLGPGVILAVDIMQRTDHTCGATLGWGGGPLAHAGPSVVSCQSSRPGPGAQSASARLVKNGMPWAQHEKLCMGRDFMAAGEYGDVPTPKKANVYNKEKILIFF